MTLEIFVPNESFSWLTRDFLSLSSIRKLTSKSYKVSPWSIKFYLIKHSWTKLPQWYTCYVLFSRANTRWCCKLNEMVFTDLIISFYSLITAFGLLNVAVIFAVLKGKQNNVTNVYVMHLRWKFVLQEQHN